MFNSKQPKKKVSILGRNLKKKTTKYKYRLRVVAQFKSIASNFYNII